MAGALAGKVAVVIGASAGIGRAYALALAGAGTKVVAAARTLGPASGEERNSLAYVVNAGRDLAGEKTVPEALAAGRTESY